MAGCSCSSKTTLPVEDLQGQSDLKRVSRPFCLQHVSQSLPFKLADSVYLELTNDDHGLFDAALTYISKKTDGVRSFRLASSEKTSRKMFDDYDEFYFKGKGKGKGYASKATKEDDTLPEFRVGLGWHNFVVNVEGGEVSLWALYQRADNPSFNSEGWSSLIIFAQGSSQVPLQTFCLEAKKSACKPKANHILFMRFEKSPCDHWSRLTFKVARSLDSVVLEDKAKKTLMEDIEWFRDSETRRFYASHGIPYHRCYLLHGPPGAGKTSFISALAGHLQYNLCFLQMDAGITDDILGKAMASLPSNSLLVLEDVDALFTNHRESERNTASLSFSGFLNCLDGLAAPEDVIVFMTSNHPERLDPAVMRPGRIDIKIEFKTPSSKTAIQYFKTFFPHDEQAAAEFSQVIGDRLASGRVSMAQLQHFFLACHRLKLDAKSAAEHAKDHQFETSGESKSDFQYS